MYAFENSIYWDFLLVFKLDFFFFAIELYEFFMYFWY